VGNGCGSTSRGRPHDLQVFRAEDGIRTRDPHLGKGMEPLRRLSPTPLSSIFSASFSAEPAELAHFRCAWFNALNRYRKPNAGSGEAAIRPQFRQ
jgi:hypothetical protein